MWKHRSYWFTKEKESSTALASQSTESFVSIVGETKLSMFEFISLIMADALSRVQNPRTEHVSPSYAYTIDDRQIILVSVDSSSPVFFFFQEIIALWQKLCFLQ